MADQELPPIETLKRLPLLRKVKLTQIRMMEERGYHLLPSDIELREASADVEGFWGYLLEKVPALTEKGPPTALWDFLGGTYVTKRDAQTRNMVVFLPPPQGKAFPTTRMNKAIAEIKRDPTIRYVDIIYEHAMGKPSLTKLAVTNRVIADWRWSDLVTPKTELSFIGGPYSVLPPDVVASDYKDNLNGGRPGLPAMCRDDPFVRYMQWVPDQVIRGQEIGDINVAVTELIKDRVVTGNTIFTTTEAADAAAPQVD